MATVTTRGASGEAPAADALLTVLDMMSDGFGPEAVVERIAPRASLFVGVADDLLVPTAETLSLYDKAREPKALHIFPPIGHHAVYYGDDLPRLLGLGRDWFERHLR